jgi:uncharacterized membrane protein YfcA
MFDALIAIAAAVAGAIAAIAGFGIGSLLTPLLAIRFGTKLAVAIVAVPHLAGTAYRFISLRKHVDRGVFLRFGLLSAAGGLIGALINAKASSPILTIILGVLLLFAGGSGVTGFADRMRFGRGVAPVAGGLSGLFGGLVGNQGGIRSAALLGFDLPKESFVATATAIALAVDAARLPVYLATQHHAMAAAWPAMLAAIAGVLVGTIFGVRLLRRIPENVFRKSVFALVLLLGIYMLAHGIHEMSGP